MRIVKLTKWSYRDGGIKGSASMPKDQAMLCLELAPVDVFEKRIEEHITQALNAEGWFNVQDIEHICMNAFRTCHTTDGVWENEFKNTLKNNFQKAIDKSLPEPS